MYIVGIILGCALVPINVLGLPQLTSSIGSQLFGEHCPGSVTLTCNTFDFGTDGLIDWYINDTLLARYTYKANHKFPLAVMVQNSLKAVAQISSSSFINGQFNFENFTLSVDLDDLLPFQGQNITCGSFGERSNVFNINKFVVVEGILNISYVAKYQGVGGELMEIEVQWIDGFEMACEVTTTYIVQLESSNGITLDITLSTQDCTNKLCSVQFTSNLDKTAESYTVIVTASNSLFNDTFTSDTIMNTTGNLINYDMCNNSAAVTCSTFSNENCSMNSMDIGSPVLIKPGDTYFVTFDMSPQNIEIIIYSNSTISVQSLNVTVDNTGDARNRGFLGTGVAVFIVGFFLLIFGFGVGIVVCCKHRNNKDDYWFMWMVTLVFSIIAMVICIVTLILWILVSASSSSASCLDEETYPPILTAAVTLSFILLFLGVVTLGGFVIVFDLKSKCLTRKDTKEQFIVHNVEFGEKAPKVRDRNTQKCSICHQQYVYVFINDKGEKEIAHNELLSGNQSICSTCNESVCDKCWKIVYVKHCKEENKVCDTCYKVYQDEQKKLSGLQFGKHKPPQSLHSEECYECGKTAGKTIKQCCTCGHWVCDRCFDEHEVDVDYLQKKIKVCKNCYAIYKMTVEDVNKEKKQQLTEEATLVASAETAINNESTL